MSERRSVSMLELDRNLSQVLRQARRAPMVVQRYGQPWVWLVSRDAWADAAHWASMDTASHPLMQLRSLLDPSLSEWPDDVVALLQFNDAPIRELQRAAVLVSLYAPGHALRLYDDLRHQQAYRHFIGMGHASIWSPEHCAGLLLASRVQVVTHWISHSLRRIPAALLAATGTPFTVEEGSGNGGPRVIDHSILSC